MLHRFNNRRLYAQGVGVVAFMRIICVVYTVQYSTVVRRDCGAPHFGAVALFTDETFCVPPRPPTGGYQPREDCVHEYHQHSDAGQRVRVGGSVDPCEQLAGESSHGNPAPAPASATFRPVRIENNKKTNKIYCMDRFDSAWRLPPPLYFR